MIESAGGVVEMKNLNGQEHLTPLTFISSVHADEQKTLFHRSPINGLDMIENKQRHVSTNNVCTDRSTTLNSFEGEDICFYQGPNGAYGTFGFKASGTSSSPNTCNGVDRCCNGGYCIGGNENECKECRVTFFKSNPRCGRSCGARKVCYHAIDECNNDNSAKSCSRIPNLSGNEETATMAVAKLCSDGVKNWQRDPSRTITGLCTSGGMHGFLDEIHKGQSENDTSDRNGDRFKESHIVAVEVNIVSSANDRFLDRSHSEDAACEKACDGFGAGVEVRTHQGRNIPASLSLWECRSSEESIYALYRHVQRHAMAVVHTQSGASSKWVEHDSDSGLCHFDWCLGDCNNTSTTTINNHQCHESSRTPPISGYSSMPSPLSSLAEMTSSSQIMFFPEEVISSHCQVAGEGVRLKGSWPVSTAAERLRNLIVRQVIFSLLLNAACYAFLACVLAIAIEGQAFTFHFTTDSRIAILVVLFIGLVVGIPFQFIHIVTEFKGQRSSIIVGMLRKKTSWCTLKRIVTDRQKAAPFLGAQITSTSKNSQSFCCTNQNTCSNSAACCCCCMYSTQEEGRIETRSRKVNTVLKYQSWMDKSQPLDQFIMSQFKKLSCNNVSPVANRKNQANNSISKARTEEQTNWHLKEEINDGNRMDSEKPDAIPAEWKGFPLWLVISKDYRLCDVTTATSLAADVSQFRHAYDCADDVDDDARHWRSKCGGRSCCCGESYQFSYILDVSRGDHFPDAEPFLVVDYSDKEEQDERGCGNGMVLNGMGDAVEQRDHVREEAGTDVNTPTMRPRENKKNRWGCSFYSVKLYLALTCLCLDSIYNILFLIRTLDAHDYYVVKYLQR